MDGTQDTADVQHRNIEPQSTKNAITGRTSRQSKRLSLNFPILSPTALSDRQSSPSPVYSVTAQSSSQNSPIRVGPSQPSPVDSTRFLTSLAAQERKVLELREELQRAENDLAKLKRQWAQYEASKKRSEVHCVEKLQHVTRPIDVTIAEEDSIAKDATPQIPENRQPERPARKSQQRVFSSSRHARTLSLLAPTTSSAKLSESASKQPIVSPAISDENASAIGTRKPTLLDSSPEDATFAKTYRDLATRHSLPPPTKDAIVKTGKQMASDLKEGFWTFFEDIRQATVGEEGINATENRSSLLVQSHATRPPAKSIPKTASLMKRTTSKELLSKSDAMNQAIQNQPRKSSKQASGIKSNDSFWKEFGLETPDKKPKQHQPLRPAQKINTQAIQSNKQEESTEDEIWDIWDSPLPVPSRTPSTDSRKAATRNSGSTVASQTMSDAPAPSGANSNGSSRTSTSSVEAETSEDHSKRHTGHPKTAPLGNISTSIPWPEITKQLHPNRLSRTITDMIKDWEITDPEAEELARHAESSEAGLEHLRSA